MNVTLRLARMSVAIDFIGAAGRMHAFYRYAYQNFLTVDDRTDARITVHCLDAEWNGLLPAGEDKDPPQIRLMPAGDPAYRVSRLSDRDNSNRVRIGPDTVSVRLLNGLLVYSPDRTEGRLLLADRGGKTYRPVYHLLWIFFAQVLGECGAGFVHAAGVALKEGGVLFFGGPGEGKSTVSRLCSGGQVFSDDSPILWKDGDGYRLFPSPIHQFDPETGPGNATAPAGVGLGRMFFLVRDAKNGIVDVPFHEAFSVIMTRHIHFFRLLTEAARVKLFDLLYDICHKISVGYLHFEKDADILNIMGMHRLEAGDVKFG